MSYRSIELKLGNSIVTIIHLMMFTSKESFGRVDSWNRRKPPGKGLNKDLDILTSTEKTLLSVRTGGTSSRGF